MAPLTYARVIARMNNLLTTLPSQLPGAGASQHRNEIKAAIITSLAVAQAGLDGDASIPGPGQLKHEVMAKIEEINARYEKSASPPPTKKNPAGGKRSAPRTGTNTGIRKLQNTRSKSVQTFSAAEKDAAAALLELFSRPVKKPAPVIYQKVPVLDVAASPETHFLAGVQYALSCLRQQSGAQDSDIKFMKSVEKELGLKNKPAGAVGWGFWDVI